VGAAYFYGMTPTNLMKFAIVDSRVTRFNRRGVNEFVRLARISTERKLKPNEVKRFAFLQTSLMRDGVVVFATKKIVTDIARNLYKSLPWRKKLSLRAKFFLRVIWSRFASLRLRLR
jgi:hypothetical protein